MALNLSTPRYVAPDVTRAPLAAENIRASQARTSLASANLAEQIRSTRVRERQADVQLAMSMAAQKDKLAHDQAMRPYQIAQAQQNVYGQALTNMSMRQKVIQNEVSFPLDYERKQAELEKTIAETDIAAVKPSRKKNPDSSGAPRKLVVKRSLLYNGAS